MYPLTVPRKLMTASALALLAAGASAQSLVNVRVLSSSPVVQAVPVNGCAPGAYYGQPSGAGAGVGAVIGGLIGSQIGRGSGAAAGAVLGALGGAVLGNTAEAQQRGYSGGCGTRYENRIVGYDVTYEWNGRQYSTRTAQDPGSWIQVQAPDGYGGQPYGAYGSAPVQTWPVAPQPSAGVYPLPGAYSQPTYPSAGEVVVAPRGYPQPVYQQPVYPQPVYPQAYPVYPAPVYQSAPVYVRPMVAAPLYVNPVGVTLSVGGRGSRVGWGVNVGSGW